MYNMINFLYMARSQIKKRRKRSWKFSLFPVYAGDNWNFKSACKTFSNDVAGENLPSHLSASCAN